MLDACRAVLACTDQEMVRLLLVGWERSWGRVGAAVRSPDVSPQELACISSSLPGMEISFAVRRVPFEVPRAAVAPEAPESPPPAPGGALDAPTPLDPVAPAEAFPPSDSPGESPVEPLPASGP